MTKEKAIKTAAQWWTDKLKERRPHSNGDNSFTSMFACMLADLGAENLTDDKLEIFNTELERSIADHIEEFPCFPRVVIGCDYNPCKVLCEAAVKAGINELCFPFKTNMAIEHYDDNNYTVSVSDGYAQPWEEINPS